MTSRPHASRYTSATCIYTVHAWASEYVSDEDGTATDGNDLMDDIAPSYRNLYDDYDVTSHWHGSYYYLPGLAVPSPYCDSILPHSILWVWCFNLWSAWATSDSSGGRCKLL